MHQFSRPQDVLGTKIMGILNVTPDSFYAASQVADVKSAITRAYQFVEQGVDILDIGGESTRPGAQDVPVEVEIARVIPVLQEMKKHTNVKISIDTRKPEVAKLALDHGATLLNDVTGFQNPKMRQLALEYSVDVCVIHMQGVPRTMQNNPSYEKGVVCEVYNWLEMQTKMLVHDGVEESRIIIDPGIGFGKSIDDNFMLIKNIKTFQKMGFRTLYGISRKSFMRTFLNRHVEKVLPATLGLNTFLMLQGVSILRVHDVEEHKDILELMRRVV
jgi:dihydropteroate synthase